MNAFRKRLGGTVLILLLAAGSGAPATAQTPINEKTPTAALVSVGDIDSGDEQRRLDP